jgi:hypothetical protein
MRGMRKEIPNSLMSQFEGNDRIFGGILTEGHCYLAMRLETGKLLVKEGKTLLSSVPSALLGNVNERIWATMWLMTCTTDGQIQQWENRCGWQRAGIEESRELAQLSRSERIESLRKVQKLLISENER